MRQDAVFRLGLSPLTEWGRGLRTMRGLTLIEVLMALVLSAILLAVLVSFFIGQQRHYNVRTQVAAMQENTRTGLDFMGRELSMTGYDPTETAGAGVVVATATTVQVTMDLDGNGDTTGADEDVTYALFNNDGRPSLGRTVGGATELVAENIAALQFTYVLDDDTVTATPADPAQIRAVDITLTGRTAQPDPHFEANNGYRNLTLTTRILLRNMAL